MSASLSTLAINVHIKAVTYLDYMIFVFPLSQCDTDHLCGFESQVPFSTSCMQQAVLRSDRTRLKKMRFSKISHYSEVFVLVAIYSSLCTEGKPTFYVDLYLIDF